MTMNPTVSNPLPPSADPGQDPSTQLPALIDKAKADLDGFLAKGAHVLCPLEVTDPPPHFYPKVVAVKISADPHAKEVYVKEKGWEGKGNNPGRPDQLELSKIGLMKISGTLGISWDESLSRRTDDGRDPMKCSYKKVGYIEDYLGKRTTLAGEKHIDLGAIQDDLILTKTTQAKAYEKKLQGPYANDVPRKWKEAIQGGYATEFIREQVQSDMSKKRLFMVELAETGAMLRAIRSKGIRTSFTPQELAKPFVDVRMVPLPGLQRPQAERAYDQLFGAPPSPASPSTPHPAHVPPHADETIIDARASTVAEDPPPSMPQSKESALADFGNCDQGQQIRMILDLAKRTKYPMPLASADMTKWTKEQLRGTVVILLDMSNPAPTGDLFGKGGRS